MTPDPLTPEERAAVESIRGDWQDARVAAMRAALDRLAPKPAAEQKPADVPSGTFTVSERGASRFNAGKGVGTVYVQSSLDQPIEVTFRAKPAPDPDREAREAAAHFWVYDDPACVGCIRRAQPADFRAHGFSHRSEIGRNDPYRGDVELYDYRLHEPDGIYRVRVYGPANPIRRQLERLAEHLHGFAWGYPPKDPPAPPPAAVDVVREAFLALNWHFPNGLVPEFTAALAARGVTFGEGNDADLLAFASWCHMRVQRPNAEDVAVWRATGGRAS